VHRTTALDAGFTGATVPGGSPGESGRWDRFFLSRIAPADRTVLTQRTVYILPTRAGWLLGATLLVLLLASINYQLNLGYALTFLLAGSALAGMHAGHANLRGLVLQLHPPPAVFAGTAAGAVVQLGNPGRRARYALGLAVWRNDAWAWTDVPAQGSSMLQVRWQPPARGLHSLPPLAVQTRFPLGTFRVWTVWRTASRVLVYPAPEPCPPPIPAAQTPGPRAASSPHSHADRHSGDWDGVRPYRQGDPRKAVLWKKAAQRDSLISREATGGSCEEVWLDLAHTGLPASAGTEARLARLCAWVLVAHQQDLRFGMRLGAMTLALERGLAHRNHCLRALALYPRTGH
jgi:uncharacterized protein (DUF58 family)